MGKPMRQAATSNLKGGNSRKSNLPASLRADVGTKHDRAVAKGRQPIKHAPEPKFSVRESVDYAKKWWGKKLGGGKKASGPKRDTLGQGARRLLPRVEA